MPKTSSFWPGFQGKVFLVVCSLPTEKTWRKVVYNSTGGSDWLSSFKDTMSSTNRKHLSFHWKLRVFFSCSLPEKLSTLHQLQSTPKVSSQSHSVSYYSPHGSPTSHLIGCVQWLLSLWCSTIETAQQSVLVYSQATGSTVHTGRNAGVMLLLDSSSHNGGNGCG